MTGQSSPAVIAIPDGIEPDERTSLLPNGHVNGNGNGFAKTKDLSQGESNGVLANGNGHGHGEQAGEGEGEAQQQYSLLEGNEEMLRRMHWLFPAVCIGVFLSAADATIVVSAYGRIGSDLEALQNTSWIATGYFLTLTSFQPLYGKLSDIFGRKYCLLFAYTVFGIGSLLCGLARNLNELVAARAFAGIGGGGMSTVVSILLSDIVPLRSRGTWQGYLNIIWASGASVGAPIGGLLADSIGWRWAFIGQFPMTIVASLMVYFILDVPRTDQSHWLTKLKRIDFLGAFSLVIAVFSLILGLDRGSNVAWSDTIAIATCSASIPLFALFVFIEMKVASHPFAPGHIILDRSLIASYLCNFFAVSAHMGSIFYIPLYLQAVDGLSATGAGLRLIPVMVCSVSGSLFSGIVMQKTEKYYYLTISCLTLSVCGSIAIFLCSGFLLSTSFGVLVGLGSVAFGGGAAITTTLISVIANADPADQAIATACTYLFRSLGSVVGVSVSATVVQQSLRTQLNKVLKDGPEADEIVEKVRQSLDFINELSPHLQRVVKGCYQKATNTAFGMSIGIIVCSLGAALFIKEKRLSR